MTTRDIIWSFRKFLSPIVHSLLDEYYIHITIPYLTWRMRRKSKIRFLFLLTELASWKTEMLYIALLKHPRFEPILGVTSNRENKGSEQILIEYLTKKQYPWIWIIEKESLVSQTSADIITFQKPYIDNRHTEHLAWKNRRALYCGIEYGLRATLGSWNMDQRYYHIAFRNFFENSDVLNDFRPLFNAKGCRIVATGVPMMDQLMLPPSHYSNPWKNQDSRKRIIYAPHHTIADYHYKEIGFSTFLEYAGFMLCMADKYKNEVFFAFKPHPRLYTILLKYWGQEKTDKYYNEWKSRENCQFENDIYDGLFKHSDAMIHDCASFITEYMYSQRPVLYIVGAQSDHSHMTSLATAAYNLHYKAANESQIEKFIKNVIGGVDPMKADREVFCKEKLRPPHGKTACENIINAILGKDEYR